MKIKIAIVVLLFCFNSALAQTASEIEKKYGQGTKVYSVSEHIWMTPEYGRDGHVCQMRLYPKRIAENTNYLGQTLQFEELRDVLNTMFPLEMRGPKQEGFGLTDVTSPVAWTTYAYRDVTFVFMSTAQAFPAPSLSIRHQQKQTELPFSVGQLERARSKVSISPMVSDFRPDRTTEIVYIKFDPSSCGEHSP